MSAPLVPLPPWTAQCRLHRHHLRITVSQPDGLELVRARLPLPPAHPRALLDLLEALARHSGHRMDAVISAAGRWETCCDDILCDGALLLGPSALVRVIHVAPRSRQLRLAPDPAWRLL